MEDSRLRTFIEAKRTELGMSQRKLATLTGVNNSTISRIESGEVYPDPDTIVKIAKALEVSTDELMLRSRYTSVPEEFVVIARKTQKLTEAQKRQFYAVLDRTVDQVLAQENEEDVGYIRKSDD